MGAIVFLEDFFESRGFAIWRQRMEDVEGTGVVVAHGAS